MNRLSRIRIFNSDSNQSHVNSLKAQINILRDEITEGNPKLEEINPLKNRLKALEDQLDSLELTRQQELKSLGDRFDALVAILSDNGQISMELLSRKIKVIKPSEYRDMKEKVKYMEETLLPSMVSNYNVLSSTLNGLNQDTINHRLLLENIRNMITEMRKIHKLELRRGSGWSGNLFFIKSSPNWGRLFGEIETSSNLVSGTQICDIGFGFDFKGLAWNLRNPIEFKIENNNVALMVPSRYNSSRYFLTFDALLYHVE